MLPKVNIFWAVSGLQQNAAANTKGSHIPLHRHPSPHTISPHQSCPFATTGESTLTHHYHSKYIIFVRVHSWCCRFYGFWKTYNAMFPPFQYHRAYFHGSKNPVLHLSPLFPPPLLANFRQPSFFLYCLHSFAFSQTSSNWNHAAFHKYNICIKHLTQ